MLEFHNDEESVGGCATTPIYGKLGEWVASPDAETVRAPILSCPPSCLSPLRSPPLFYPPPHPHPSSLTQSLLSLRA
jgi:hypothetical protein